MAEPITTVEAVTRLRRLETELREEGQSLREAGGGCTPAWSQDALQDADAVQAGAEALEREVQAERAREAAS